MNILSNLKNLFKKRNPVEVTADIGKGKCSTCRFNCDSYLICTAQKYYHEVKLMNAVCYEGELWEQITDETPAYNGEDLDVEHREVDWDLVKQQIVENSYISTPRIVK